MKQICLVRLLCHDTDRAYLRHMRTLARLSEVDLGNKSDLEFFQRTVHSRAVLCISDMHSSLVCLKEFLVTYSILNFRQRLRKLPSRSVVGYTYDLIAKYSTVKATIRMYKHKLQWY